jgi:hypothetical protein
VGTQVVTAITLLETTGVPAGGAGALGTLEGALGAGTLGAQVGTEDQAGVSEDQAGVSVEETGLSEASPAGEVTAAGTLEGVVLPVGSTPAPLLPGQSVTVGAQEVMVTSSVS